ncbi:MAG: DUF5925 domain-containing protein [Acidimicrobiales bacterium]
MSLNLTELPPAAAVRVDGGVPEPLEVLHRAAMAPVVSGEEPFVWSTWLSNGCDPFTLLPGGTTVIRTAIDGKWQALLAEGEGFHICIDSRSAARVTVSAANQELAESIGAELRKRSPEPENRAAKMIIRFWYQKKGGMDWSSHVVSAPAWNEVEANYPAVTRATLAALMALDPAGLEGSAGRLLLWHGAPGTGKTYGVRALARAWSSWCEPHYLCDISATLQEPANLLDALLKQPDSNPDGEPRRWKLLIAEDVDRNLDVHNATAVPIDRLHQRHRRTTGAELPEHRAAHHERRAQTAPPGTVTPGPLPRAHGVQGLHPERSAGLARSGPTRDRGGILARRAVR